MRFLDSLMAWLEKPFLPWIEHLVAERERALRELAEAEQRRDDAAARLQEWQV